MNPNKYVAVYSDSNSLDCPDCAFFGSKGQCGQAKCLIRQRVDRRGVVFLTFEDFATRKLRGEAHELAR